MKKTWKRIIAFTLAAAMIIPADMPSSQAKASTRNLSKQETAMKAAPAATSNVTNKPVVVTAQPDYYKLYDSVNTGTTRAATGQSVTFSAKAVANTGYSLTYQWQKKNISTAGIKDTSFSDIPGATNYYYTVASYNPMIDNTEYQCVLTMKSDTTGVVVQTANIGTYRIITKESTINYTNSKTFYRTEGETVTMSMTDYSYDTAQYTQKRVMWKKNGSILKDANGSVVDNTQYTINALKEEDFASYTCYIFLFPSNKNLSSTDALTDASDRFSEYYNMVSDDELISQNFDVTEKTGFAVSTSSLNPEVALNASINLTADASDRDTTKYPISYQWQKSTVTSSSAISSSSDSTFSDIAGQTGSSLTINNVSYPDFVSYRVIITMKRASSGKVMQTQEKVFNVMMKEPDTTEFTAVKKIGDSVDLATNLDKGTSDYPTTFTWVHTNYNYNIYEEKIAGAETASYALSIKNDADFGTYICTAKNTKFKNGTVTFIYHIYSDDNFYAIAKTAKNQIKKIGDSATFQVGASCDDSSTQFTYDWSFDGDYEGTFTGSTTDTLSLTNLSKGQFGTYECVVTDVNTMQTKTISFTLQLYTSVTVKYATDSDFYKETGDSVTMGLDISNPENISLVYRWYKNGNELPYSTNSVTINSLLDSQFGDYTCKIYANDDLIDSKDFSITDYTAEDLNLYVESTTDIHQYVKLGAAVNMGVSASTKAGRTISYQWYQGDDAILGATAATYSIASMKINDFGRYTCKVKDSEEETWTVSFYIGHNTLDANSDADTDISNSSDPGYVSKKAVYGKKYLLSTNVKSDAAYPVSYQWYFTKDIMNGSISSCPIYGATSSSYLLSKVSKDNVGYYMCKVSDSNSTYSLLYYVYANTNLKVSASKLTYYATDGNAVSMAVKASCGKKFTISYQWYQYQETANKSDNYRWEKLNGAVAAKYTTTASHSTYGDYRVVVSTEGECKNIYLTLSKTQPLSLKKIAASTDMTFAGSKIKLSSKVKATKGAKVTYQWFVSDANYNNYDRSVSSTSYTQYTKAYAYGKNAKGKVVAKPAIKASVIVTAPALENSNVIVGSPVQTYAYKLCVTSVINGKTYKDTSYTYIQVVAPAFGKKLIQSSHHYATPEENDDNDIVRYSVYGYKKSGASALKATFSKKTFINRNGDCIYVIDGKGKSTRYFGGELAKKTLSLSGSKFAVVIMATNSDASNYGFAVTKVKKVSALKLAKSAVKLGVKESYKISVNGAGKKKISYTSSKKKIATVSKKGLVKAKKRGKAVITVKVGSKKLKLKVTVKKAASSIKVKTKTVTVAPGKKAVAKYVVSGASNKIVIKNAKALKKAYITVKKASDNKLLVKVGKKAKKGTKKVSVSTFNGKKASFRVKVK